MSTEFRWFDIAVAMMPTLLYATLGALGLAVGSAGAAVNLAFTMSTMPRIARMLLALLVTFAAFITVGAHGREAPLRDPFGRQAWAPERRSLVSWRDSEVCFV